MRYTGPKNRISRREGIDLGLKTPGTKAHASLLKKMGVLPGQHGVKGSRRKVSERGRQLRESQKLKYIFGLSTKQLKNYFYEAVKKTGNTALFLSQFLEKRLDNIVYRLGFAPTRAAARQLVTHKHVKIGDVIVSIPSVQVRPGSVISILKAKEPAKVEDLLLPSWLERKAVLGKVTGEPTSELIEKQVSLRLIIEYFSR